MRKTQLVTVSNAAAGPRPLLIFSATVPALATAATVVGFVGGSAAHFLQGPWPKRVVDAVFIGTGVLYVAGAPRHPDHPLDFSRASVRILRTREVK